MKRILSHTNRCRYSRTRAKLFSFSFSFMSQKMQNLPRLSQMSYGFTSNETCRPTLSNSGVVFLLDIPMEVDCCSFTKFFSSARGMTQSRLVVVCRLNEDPEGLTIVFSNSKVPVQLARHCFIDSLISSSVQLMTGAASYKLPVPHRPRCEN